MSDISATNLLICLRRSGERLRPALADVRRRRPRLEPFLAPWRVLTQLAEVPLRLPACTRYYIASRIRPNSKAEAVVSELIAAGIDPDAIWTFERQSGHLPARALRAGIWTLRLAPMVIRLALARRLDDSDRQVLVGRAAMRLLLRRTPSAVPVIVSDVSPVLYMLWSAAISLRRAPMWWQDDYHHIGSLPYPVSAAAVLNQGGYAAVLARSPDALITRRPQTVVKLMRAAPSAPRLGAATNASFAATPAQVALLAGLRDQLGGKQLLLRLHPNSPLHGGNLAHPWLAIAPADEPLATFATRIDLAIVGNSAVQMRLLGEGVPVLHVAGLDEHGFDLYGYMREGFSFGSPHLEDVCLEAINRHYADPIVQQRIADFMSLRRDIIIPDLAALSHSRGDWGRSF